MLTIYKQNIITPRFWYGKNCNRAFDCHYNNT